MVGIEKGDKYHLLKLMPKLDAMLVAMFLKINVNALNNHKQPVRYSQKNMRFLKIILTEH